MCCFRPCDHPLPIPTACSVRGRFGSLGRGLGLSSALQTCYLYALISQPYLICSLQPPISTLPLSLILSLSYLSLFLSSPLYPIWWHSSTDNNHVLTNLPTLIRNYTLTSKIWHRLLIHHYSLVLDMWLDIRIVIVSSRKYYHRLVHLCRN